LYALKVILTHLNSTQALKFSGRQLPDWGFNQHEVVTDKIISQDDTVWNVEEHRYTKSNGTYYLRECYLCISCLCLRPVRYLHSLVSIVCWKL